MHFYDLKYVEAIQQELLDAGRRQEYVRQHELLCQLRDLQEGKPVIEITDEDFIPDDIDF